MLNSTHMDNWTHSKNNRNGANLQVRMPFTASPHLPYLVKGRWSGGSCGVDFQVAKVRNRSPVIVFDGLVLGLARDCYGLQSFQVHRGALAFRSPQGELPQHVVAALFEQEA